jgi:hypothetical protein
MIMSFARNLTQIFVFKGSEIWCQVTIWQQHLELWIGTFSKTSRHSKVLWRDRDSGSLGWNCGWRHYRWQGSFAGMFLIWSGSYGKKLIRHKSANRFSNFAWLLVLKYLYLDTHLNSDIVESAILHGFQELWTQSIWSSERVLRKACGCCYGLISMD